MARKITTRSNNNEKKRNTIGKIIYRLALVAFLGEIFYVLFFSGFLTINVINISGTQNVSQEQIRNIVNDNLEGNYFGVIRKNNFLLCRPGQMERELAINFKKIEAVKVTRKFPGTLYVNIQERKPALVLFSDNRHFIVDNKGQIFEEISADSSDFQNSDWPVLADSSNRRAELYENVLDADLVSYILDSRNRLKNELEIDLDRQSETPNRMSADIRMKTAEGWMIYFNTNLDLKKELGMLKAVLDEKIGRDSRASLEYIDLRSDNRVFYKFKETAPEEVKSEEPVKTDQSPKVEEKKSEKKKKK